jgi:hypothetical protein
MATSIGSGTAAQASYSVHRVYLSTETPASERSCSNLNLDPISNLTAVNPGRIYMKACEKTITKIHSLESLSFTLEIFFKM